MAFLFAFKLKHVNILRQQLKQGEIMTHQEVKQLRKSLGLTQLEFANKLHTTPVTVCKWENKACKPSKLFIREMKKMG